MGCTLSASEKLFRRINREFDHKKFIGDIAVNDEEFQILLEELKKAYHLMGNIRDYEKDNPVLCVALVQIGIRYYDGNFWRHIKNLLGDASFSQTQQGWLGKSFVSTLIRHNKVNLGESDRVDSILMHAFVSNAFADRFFNFLFAFYCIDLERDLSRLDREMMNNLIEIIQRNDNSNRTYWLVEQTADAVRQSVRSGKTRIRRYLKLIDKAFWGEELPVHSENRLTKLFISWTQTSKELEEEKCALSTKRTKKSFSSPYLRFNEKSFDFRLILPPQIIRNQQFSDLRWEIRIDETVQQIEINPYKQGVTGYVTEEETIKYSSSDLFSDIRVSLINGYEKLRSFHIASEKLRFFDSNGYLTQNDKISAGRFHGFSPANFVPESEAACDSYTVENILYSYFELEDGDIIRLPDGKPLCVGRRLVEGLLPRNRMDGVWARTEENDLFVYSDAPSVFVKIIPSRISGTAIRVNDHAYRLRDALVAGDGIANFKLMDRSDEEGYLFDLRFFGCLEDGFYDVELDVPNDHTARHWRFVLKQGLTYHFEDAPYLFKTRGTLCLPSNQHLKPLSSSVKLYITDMQYYNFDIVPGEPRIYLEYQGIKLGFEIPALSYRFENEEWQTSVHTDIWHTDFQPKLWIKYNADKIQLLLDDSYDDDETDEDHEETFVKNKANDIFECDLNRFKSWLNRDRIRRIIYLKLPDVKKPIPLLGIYMRSVLLSALLKGDLENGLLTGEFDIVGQAKYYVDLYCNGSCIAKKESIQNGRAQIHTKLRSGVYEAYIFEAEDEEDDFGFGDPIYHQIGERKLDLLNPEDLQGKHIQIRMIRPAFESSCYLELKCSYQVCDLQPVSEDDKHNYFGRMIVRNRNEEVLATFEVNVEFFDLENLHNAYITFLSDGDTLEFLYDEQKNVIVKQEDKLLTKSQAYRRYKQSLFPEDYIYEVEFVDMDPGAAADVDDSKYNNLVASHEAIPVEEMGLKAKEIEQLKDAQIAHSEQIASMNYDGLKRIFSKDLIRKLSDKMRGLGYEAWSAGIVTALKQDRLTVMEQLNNMYGNWHEKKKTPIYRIESCAPQSFDQASSNHGGIILIEEMGLQTKIYNCLKRARIYDVESIAMLDWSRLMKIRNLGNRSRLELINRMREFGYDDWADKVEAERHQKNLQNNNEILIQNPVDFSVLEQTVENNSIEEHPDQAPKPNTINSYETPSVFAADDVETENLQDLEVLPQTKLSHTELNPMAYNCLKAAGLITVEDLQKYLAKKGLKGLNNINRLNSGLRLEVYNFVLTHKLV